MPDHKGLRGKKKFQTTRPDIEKDWRQSASLKFLPDDTYENVLHKWGLCPTVPGICWFLSAVWGTHYSLNGWLWRARTRVLSALSGHTFATINSSHVHGSPLAVCNILYGWLRPPDVANRRIFTIIGSERGARGEWSNESVSSS